MIQIVKDWLQVSVNLHFRNGREEGLSSEAAAEAGLESGKGE